MEEFHFLSFCLGIILCSILFFINIKIRSKSLKKEYLKPFEKLLTKPKEYFRFGSRSKNLVTIYYGDKDEPYIFINLDTKKIAILEENNVIGVEVDLIKNELDDFYKKLLTYFNDEIFNDVVKVNDDIYSSNLYDSALSTEIIKSIQDSGILSKILQGDEDSPYEEDDEPILDINKEIDRILDKISDSGVESLTEKEQMFLKNNSK